MADQHANSSKQNNADLYHGRGYRAKGHNKIKSSDRKERYNDDEKIKGGLKHLIDSQIKTYPRVKDRATQAHAERHYFQSGKNFTHWRVPYDNQAHHMLPQQFWNPMDSEQKAILRTLQYSINDGENIIFLPMNDIGLHIHGLPKHNGSHPTYSEAVLTDSEKIKKDIDKAVQEKKKCEDYKPPESIKEKLIQLQQDYWDIITASTSEEINDVIKLSPAQESDL